MVGFKLHGKLPEGATATDLVLTVTQMLRKKGVVGKFVEFYGDGLGALSLADRATIANMAPEYGATIGVFPIDDADARISAPDQSSATEQIELVEAYAKEQGLFRVEGAPEPVFTDTLALDLATVVPSLAGPEASAGSHQPAGREEEFPRWTGRGAEDRATSARTARRDRFRTAAW